MRKALSVGIIVLLAVGASFMVYASNVSNSKHNLSPTSPFPSIDTMTNVEVCVFCHTPHGADLTELTPLWNHEVTTASFTMYNDPAGSMDATVVAAPSGVSKACLGCHDGTIAIDSMANDPPNYCQTTQTFTNNLNIVQGVGNGEISSSASSYLGTDLRNDHPISIDYKSPGTGAPEDADLEGFTGQYVDATRSGYTNIALFGSGPVKKIECGSCHNVHDSTWTPFLRASNVNSLLCQSCHLK